MTIFTIDSFKKFHCLPNKCFWEILKQLVLIVLALYVSLAYISGKSLNLLKKLSNSTHQYMSSKLTISVFIVKLQEGSIVAFLCVSSLLSALMYTEKVILYPVSFSDTMNSFIYLKFIQLEFVDLGKFDSPVEFTSTIIHSDSDIMNGKLSKVLLQIV